MSHFGNLNDPLYQNWIKAGLALKYGRDVVSIFLQRSIKEFKSDTLINNSKRFCDKCTFLNVIPCRTNSVCLSDNRGNCKKHKTSDVLRNHRPCPDGVCDKLYLAIKRNYASGGKGPNWNQSDPQQWCSNDLEIAKCFMPVGYENKHDIGEFDFSGIMSLIINSKFIQTKLSHPFNLQFYQKLRDIRNCIMHSGSYSLTAQQLEDSIKIITKMVDRVLGNNLLPVEQKILLDIKKLAGMKFCVTTSDELQVVREQINTMSLTILQNKQDTIRNKTKVKVECKKLQTELNDLKEHHRNLEEELHEVKVEQLLSYYSKDKVLTIAAIGIICMGLIAIAVWFNQKGEPSAVRSKKEEMSTPVLKNDMYRVKIKHWEEQDNDFVETRASRYLMNLTSVPERFIMVIGDGGSGKKFLIRHEALRLHSKGFEIIPISDPSAIQANYRNSHSQVFVSENCFGSMYLEEELVNKWSRQVEDIKLIIQNKSHIFLFSSRLDLYKEVLPNPMKTLNISKVDLTSGSFILTNDEKIALLNKYLPKVNGYIQLYLSSKIHPYFPLLCRLSKKQKTTKDIEALFNNPGRYIANSIEYMKNKSKLKFCSVCLCVMFQNKLRSSWLSNPETLPFDKRNAFEAIMNEFKLDPTLETDMKAIKRSLRILKNSFTEYSNGTWFIIHTKIFEQALKKCGQYLFNTFLQFGDRLIIANSYILKSIHSPKEKENKETLLITVSKSNEINYFSRLSSDVQNFGLDIAFDNKQLLYKTFRNKMITFFLNDGGIINYFKSLCLKGNCCLKYNPFIRAVVYGYIDMIEMMIIMGCDLRYDIISIEPQNSYWRLHDILILVTAEKQVTITTLLHVAALNGQDHIVQYIIDIRGNRNERQVLVLQQYLDVSYFSLRCLSQMFELLAPRLLDGKHTYYRYDSFLDNKIRHSLYGSKNHIYILKYGIFVDTIDTNGKTALMLASGKGLDVTVLILIQNGADVNMRDNDGFTALMLAASSGFSNTVSLLVKNGADIDIKDNKGRTAFLWGSVQGEDKITSLLIKCGSEVNSIDNDGLSALMLGSFNGNIKIVSTLLSKGANINLINKNHTTALMMACIFGSTDIALLLINHGADINIRNKKGLTALIIACLFGNTDLSLMLLQHGADANNRDKEGNTALMLVCTANVSAIYSLGDKLKADRSLHGKIANIIRTYQHTPEVNNDIISMLINKDADVNSVDINGKTALMLACSSQMFHTVKLLLEKGANVNIRDHSGFTALYFASIFGTKDIVLLLLKHGANINSMDNNGTTPLMVACILGLNDTVSLLIDQGADVNIRDKIFGQTALMLASRYGIIFKNNVSQLQNHSTIAMHMVSSLVAYDKTKTNMRDKYGTTALMNACMKGREDVAKLLLDSGSDINIRDINGKTALIHSCSMGLSKIVLLLLDHGADLNIRDNDGRTALMYASTYGMNNSTKMLENFANISNEMIAMIAMNGKTDRNIRDNNGRTALMHACMQGAINASIGLIDIGVDVNAQDTLGMTAMMWACIINNSASSITDLLEIDTFVIHTSDAYGIVSILLDNGADVNMKEYKHGWTALMLVCLRERHDIALLLIENGADINIGDSGGKTALMFSILRGLNGTVSMLVKKGADVNIRDNDGITALMCACSFNRSNSLLDYKHKEILSIDMVRYLVVNGRADINIRDNEGRSALIYACVEGIVSVISFLLDNEAEVHYEDKNGLNAFLIITKSSIQGNVLNTIIAMFLDNGLAINTLNSKGFTPLMWACMLGKDQITTALIRSGADINMIDTEGKSALILACINVQITVSSILMSNGADVNIRDDAGRTALMWACVNNMEYTILLLIKHGADTAIRDNKGYTALIWAILSKKSDLIILLVTQGANINIHDNDGLTPLMIAILYKMTDIAFLLIHNGANIYAFNNDGRPTINYACELDNIDGTIFNQEMCVYLINLTLN